MPEKLRKKSLKKSVGLNVGVDCVIWTPTHDITLVNLEERDPPGVAWDSQFSAEQKLCEMAPAELKH